LFKEGFNQSLIEIENLVYKGCLGGFADVVGGELCNNRVSSHFFKAEEADMSQKEVNY
jgi:hypothetical protein